MRTSPRRRRPRAPRALLAAVAAVLVLTLSGCLLGERPTLDTGSVPVATDPNSVAVIDRLDAAAASTFTASYDILVKYGNVQSTAVVVHDGERTSVTIGSTRFLTDGANVSTCTVGDESTCTDRIDASRVANLQMNPGFWGESASARVRRDTASHIAATVADTRDIAGQPARCVTIPVTNGNPEYCALDAGPLAFQDTGDLTIELTSYATTADEAAFTRA